MIDVLVWVAFGIWYVTGLGGSSILCDKGYALSIGACLWGAMLGPLQLLLAWMAPPR